MKINYKNNRVKSYCENHDDSMREFKDRKVVLNLAMLIQDLKAFPHIVDFARVPKLLKYKLHDLHNDKDGEKSLRITYSHRMEIEVVFYAENENDEDIITILEVTKHYE